jgi:hypothetical protein
MTSSPKQALTELTRRVHELETDLLRARSGQASHTSRHQGTRSPWLGALLLITATWMLAAQAPAGVPPDIEQRLRALESMVRRAPGNITQMTAPLEILGADGKPIVRVGPAKDGSVPVSITRLEQNGGGMVSVSAGGAVQAVVAAAPTGHGVVSVLDAKQVTRAQLTGGGYATVMNSGGEQIAGLTQGDAGDGRIGIWRGKNKVIDISTDAASGGSGMVNVNTPSGQTVARLSTVDGGGEVAVSNAQGARVAAMRALGEAGALSVMNSSGTPVAGLIGSEASGGTVAVAPPGGATVAAMRVSEDGRGLFQVHAKGGGTPLAVLTQSTERVGGLIQIYNASTSVANLTVGASNGGYLQLADASGNPTVEAGTLPGGAGVVRAGPTYRCIPSPSLPNISLLPDCIMGGEKGK